jgi:predicted nucleic acid-binding protein
MVPRKLGCPQFFLDANRVNARCKLSAMNQLEKWHADGVISLRFPHHAQSEAESGRDARRTQKARSLLIPFPSITLDEERKRLSEIERTIFGNARLSKQDENDALIVFTAQKYAAILVTADGKLLRAAKQLHHGRIGVQVMTDEDAVKLVRRFISRRDQMARADAARESISAPDWVGKD